MLLTFAIPYFLSEILRIPDNGRDGKSPVQHVWALKENLSVEPLKGLFHCSENTSFK